MGVGLGGGFGGLGGRGKDSPSLAAAMVKKETEETKQTGKKKRRESERGGVILPVHHTPHDRTEKTRVGRQQVRGHDARLDAVGGYAGAVVAVVDPARVDDGGDFRVPVAFPRDRFCQCRLLVDGRKRGDFAGGKGGDEREITRC